MFYAVLTASLLLAIGIAIFNITYKEFILSSGARESANAFYAADTGLECALFWDLKHTGLSSPAFGFYGDSLASGLIGYWRFEDGSESPIAVDSSGSGKTGTLTNMDAASSWIAGKIDEALAFDGINDYVAVNDMDYTNQMSGALWVILNDVFPQQIFIGQTDGVSNVEVQMQLQGTAGGGKFRIRVSTTAGADIVNSTTVPVAGVWYHVAWTYDGNSLRMYVNGAEETNVVQNLGVGNISDVNLTYGIGARNTGALSTNGVIDDVRIYNRALSPTEVDELSESPYSNPTFVHPIVKNSNALCLGADITDPATGWDLESGWNVSTTTSSASTTFDIKFDNGRCATVEVVKNIATTTIISRGYNSCDLNDPRRVERAIRAIY